MVSILVRASIDGAILVAAVWVMSRILRLSPATRTILWWCAAAKFVVALAWTTPIAIPILPVETAVVDRAERVAAPRAAIPANSLPRRAAVQQPVAGPFARALREWSTFAAIGWGLGLMFVAIVGVRRWRDTVRLLAASEPAPGDLRQRAIDLASRLRLRRVPGLRISHQVETPLVTGLVRPVVLLPSARFDALSERQQQMALCHELAHLKRADLWLGCVPALAERLFFFHPLVQLASREYALAREAACDAAVMETLVAAPQEYGRLLLALGVSHPRTGLTAAGGAWSFLNLKRRIAMLQDVSGRSQRSRLMAAGVVGLAVVAIVPMQLAARPGAVPAPSAAAAPAQYSSPGERQSRELAARNAATQVESRPNARGLTFVLMLEDGQQTTSGSSEDVVSAKRHARNGEPLLWFRFDGREYVVRDPELLRQARTLWNDVYGAGIGPETIRDWTRSLESEAWAKHAELSQHKEHLEAEAFAKHAELSQHKEHLEAEAFAKHAELFQHKEHLEAEAFAKHAELFERNKHVEAEVLGQHAEILERNKHFEAEALAKHADADELRKHAELAAAQGALGARLGSMALEQAWRTLGEARASSDFEADRAELERRRSMDEEKMREFEHRFKRDIDGQMRELHQQLRAIEGPIREMAKPLEGLGHEMEAFHQTIDAATRKASDQMRALVERAIASGLAQTVR